MIFSLFLLANKQHNKHNKDNKDILSLANEKLVLSDDVNTVMVNSFHGKLFLSTQQKLEYNTPTISEKGELNCSSLSA